MDPSIWSTRDPNTFIVSLGVDPSESIGQITKRDDGWVILTETQPRVPYLTLQDAASALAGLSGEIDYYDYLLGKGEDTHTVLTTAAQMKRIVDEGGWKMISASARHPDDVN
jgi:hypothetical protein